MLSTGPTLVVLVVYALASMRVTRLINADTVTSFIRLYLAGKIRTATLEADEAASRGQTTLLASALERERRWTGVFKFVQCPWCIGFWVPLIGGVGAVWVIKYGWTLDWWAILPLALAASHLVGICARFADTEEIEIEEASGS